jgi:hypothetical protein
MKVSGPKCFFGYDGEKIFTSTRKKKTSHFQPIANHCTVLTILAHEKLAFMLSYMKNFSLFALFDNSDFIYDQVYKFFLRVYTCSVLDFKTLIECSKSAFHY